MPRALVSLGANSGDRRANLERAAIELQAVATGGGLVKSSWYAAPPVGGPTGQPEFLNGAIAFHTAKLPLELLGGLQEIEAALGRVREQHWGPRSIDLDLIYYGDEIVETPELSAPHPRMTFRRFVLAPAAEIAPEWPDPRDGLTIAARLARLRMQANRVALVGRFGEGASLRQALAAASPAACILEEFTTLDQVRQAYSSRQEGPTLLVIGDVDQGEDPWTVNAAAVLQLRDPANRNAALTETLAAIEAMQIEPVRQS